MAGSIESRAEDLVNSLNEELHEILEEKDIPIESLGGKELKILADVKAGALRGIAPAQLVKYFDEKILELIDPSSVDPQTFSGRKPSSVYNARPPLLRGRKGGRRTRKSKPARKHKRYSRTRTQSKRRR
jgi:hypothetical protein